MARSSSSLSSADAVPARRNLISRGIMKKMNNIMLAAALAVATTTYGQTINVNNAIVGSGDNIYDATGGFSSAVANTGNDQYFSSDHGSADWDGIAPYQINLNGNSSVLTMSSVTGSFNHGSLGAVTLNDGGGYNDPDGTVISGGYSGPTVPVYSDNPANHGLSGIYEPGAGGLVGVFLNSTITSSSTAPATLNFTTQTRGGIPGAGDSETTLSPLLGQVFLIGDGLTGDETGSVQQFVVPTGATELFLGVSDAYAFDGNDYGGPGAYNDNLGYYDVSFTVSGATAGVPDRVNTLGLLAGALALLMFARLYLSSENRRTVSAAR